MSISLQNGVNIESLTFDARGIRDETAKHPQLSPIYIGPLRYTIHHDTELIEAGLEGRVRHATGEIQLRPGLTPEFELVVLWHEVLHVIMTQGGLDAYVPDDNLEALLNGLSLGIADAVQTNTRLRGE